MDALIVIACLIGLCVLLGWLVQALLWLVIATCGLAFWLLAGIINFIASIEIEWK